MLEVKDLRKVYKTKNGANVNALDGVTLQFPERGMIFLLGKSGSGKSTLLNVCGGLDSPTSGEVIVKGRSSKSFTGSDFDSYRNTFIGFIFQEYNILNEFSVEDNIALALELQGKPKDKKAIQALLEEVDLVGYAKRKPNTLSGGQKQRIAIARALIKAPEIIMADEPTGALDSNTGKQVFDTLKKLSRNKLVIVVSHDRDFAEQYGDRIIELKDGKVLSDVTKTEIEQQQLSENVNTVGDVLCIKSGADLNESDFEKIKSFLKKSKKDVIIANNEEDVQNFKKVSRISDSGSKEMFCDTDVTALKVKQYSKEESRFIRSKLPLKHAMKIGASGLKNKPFRLTMTVFLCTVAFVLFSLLSTMNFYDSRASFIQTMADVQPSVMQVERLYMIHETWYESGELQSEYSYYDLGRFTANELRGLSAQFGAEAFGALDHYGYFNLQQSNSSYYLGNVKSYSVLPEGHSLRQQINGKYPDSVDQILITSYLADVLYQCKVLGVDGEELNLSGVNDLIGKTVSISGFNYTISGILDVGPVASKFDALKDLNDPRNELVYELSNYLADGLFQYVFVSQERIEDLARDYFFYAVKGEQDYCTSVFSGKYDGRYDFATYSNSFFWQFSQMQRKYYLFSGENAEITDSQVIMPAQLYAEIATNQLYEKIKDLESSTDKTDTRQRALEELINLGYDVMNGGIFRYDEDLQEHVFEPFSDQELQENVQRFAAEVKAENIDQTIGLKCFINDKSMAVGDLYELEVAGVYIQSKEDYMATFYVSDDVFQQMWEQIKKDLPYYSVRESKYQMTSDAVFSKILLPYVHTAQSVEEFWDVYSNEQWDENETQLRLTGMFVSQLRMVDGMVKDLSKVFLYVGLVFAVFAVLLFSNFISTSISQKKKEIGILRAVGARGFDVFKIFFSESFVIGFICVLLSVVASVILCNVINLELASGIGVSLLVFGLPSLAVLVGVAFVTVVIATFLPVYNAAKKKPVDSIRAL